MPVEVLNEPLSFQGVRSRANEFGNLQYLIGDIFSMLNTHKNVLKEFVVESCHPDIWRAWMEGAEAGVGNFVFRIKTFLFEGT